MNQLVAIYHVINTPEYTFNFQFLPALDTHKTISVNDPAKSPLHHFFYLDSCNPAHKSEGQTPQHVTAKPYDVQAHNEDKNKAVHRLHCREHIKHAADFYLWTEVTIRTVIACKSTCGCYGCDLNSRLMIYE